MQETKVPTRHISDVTGRRSRREEGSSQRAGVQLGERTEVSDRCVFRGTRGLPNQSVPQEFIAARDRFMTEAFKAAEELSEASGLPESDAAAMFQRLMLRLSEAIVEAETAALHPAKSI